MKIFYLIFIWILFLISVFFIGRNCQYHSDGGPFNMNLSFMSSLMFVGVLFFTLFLLKQTEENPRLKAVHQIIVAFILTVFAVYIAKLSYKVKSKHLYPSEDLYIDTTSVWIVFFTVIFLLTLSIVNFIKKRPNSAIKLD